MAEGSVESPIHHVGNLCGQSIVVTEQNNHPPPLTKTWSNKYTSCYYVVWRQLTLKLMTQIVVCIVNEFVVASVRHIHCLPDNTRTLVNGVK